jgi:hypothetical protein
MFCGRSPNRDTEKESRMTPSEYGNGSSLEHDRMQADVLEWIRQHGQRTAFHNHYGDRVELKRVGVWAEAAIAIDGKMRAFVDILERWEPVAEKDSKGRHIGVRRFVAYEVKPKLTTIGGLIRQMQAEELLLEQWGRSRDLHYTVHVNTVPVINHNDPELSLLRRLWPGAVAIWNAEEHTLA